MGILNRGERAPDFVLPIMDGAQTRFYSRAGGRPTLLIFTGEERVLEGLERSEEVDVFIVSPLELVQVNATVFIDGENAVGKAYGLEGDFAAFALDANLRVLSGIEDPNAFDQIYQAFESLPSHRAIDVDVQAPVLLIPNVLTPDICQVLINVWATKGNTETGVESSQSGMRRDVIDYENKNGETTRLPMPDFCGCLLLQWGAALCPRFNALSTTGRRVLRVLRSRVMTRRVAVFFAPTAIISVLQLPIAASRLRSISMTIIQVGISFFPSLVPTAIARQQAMRSRFPVLFSTRSSP